MKATTNTYNGWTNYETWAVNLWMSQEQGSHDAWNKGAIEYWERAKGDGIYTRRERATLDFADAIKEMHKEGAFEHVTWPSVYADLLNAALSEVNWDEIARNWLEGMLEAGTIAD